MAGGGEACKSAISRHTEDDKARSMTDKERFIAAVVAELPDVIFGVKPHSVNTGLQVDGSAAVVAVYFLRAFYDGKPMVPQPSSDDLKTDWQQFALHVTASGREMAIHSNDLDGLAKRKVAAALAVIPADDPFFAVAAA